MDDQLAFQLARLRFAPIVERRIEAVHKLLGHVKDMSLRMLLPHHFGLTLRKEFIGEVFLGSDTRESLSFVMAFQRAKQTDELVRALGLTQHPLIA